MTDLQKMLAPESQKQLRARLEWLFRRMHYTARRMCQEIGICHRTFHAFLVEARDVELSTLIRFERFIIEKETIIDTLIKKAFTFGENNL